ncbi:Branched-chain-amino-acid aminotransferase [Fusarium oxysporum f. sp. albedinis]|nr:Branched-chain-amino-acid aminotransferase [Fusarium oxysporum f. sp. albedinis]
MVNHNKGSSGCTKFWAGRSGFTCPKWAIKANHFIFLSLYFGRDLATLHHVEFLTRNPVPPRAILTTGKITRKKKERSP